MIKNIYRKVRFLFKKKLVMIWFKQHLITATQPINIKSLFKLGFNQRVLRINSNIPWPTHKSSLIARPDKINPGTRNPGLSRGCHIDGRNGIIFGKNVWVGPYVSIISQNHNVNDFSEYLEDKPIIIGDNCWLGAHVIILPGVKLGNHIIVAAGSIVTKSILEDNIIIAGIPAKKIKKIEKYKGKIILNDIKNQTR